MKFYAEIDSIIESESKRNRDETQESEEYDLMKQERAELLKKFRQQIETQKVQMQPKVPA